MTPVEQAPGRPCSHSCGHSLRRLRLPQRLDNDIVNPNLSYRPLRSAALAIVPLALLIPARAASKLPPPASVQIDFNRDVKPILEANCLGCHGSRQQQSGLRLDKRQNALRGGDYGAVIMPGRRPRAS